MELRDKYIKVIVDPSISLNTKYTLLAYHLSDKVYKFNLISLY